MVRTLTVAEKILYHLSMFIKTEDRYEVPFSITQDGIAQSSGISRAHAAIELKKLRETNLITEKLSHVKRAKSRRKVYFLTGEGKSRASKIVEHVKSGSVEAGIDLARINQNDGPAKKLKRHRTPIPEPRHFFGREKELLLLKQLEEGDDFDLILIMGLGGIGKTSLLSRSAKESKSSVFWFSCNEWETELSLLKALAEFFEEADNNRLSNYLRADRIDPGEIGYILGEAFSENRRTLILDDVDNAPRLFPTISMIIENLGPNKLFMSAESRPGFLTEISGNGRSIKEVMIDCIDRSAAIELLKIRDITGENAAQLADMTGYHPLMLQLVPADDKKSARMELSNFVEKKFLKGLSSKDMAIVEKCSVFRKPFTDNYLPRDERGILRIPIFYHISGKSAIHKMVRNIILDQIPDTERCEYHSRAADYFLAEETWSERLHHLIKAGRYFEAEMLIHYHSEELLEMESPNNLLEEIELIPPKISRYVSSLRLLSARALSLRGDEEEATSKLFEIAKHDEGEERAEALIRISDRNLSKEQRKVLIRGLKIVIEDQDISEANRAKAALSLSSLKFSENRMNESEHFANIGISFAGNSFALETVSSLNHLIAQLYISRRAYDDAARFLAQTAPSFAGRNRSKYHRLLSRARFGAGDFQGARKNLEIGSKIAEDNGQYRELAEMLLELCDVRIRDEDMDGAAEACYRCIEVSSTIGDGDMLAAAQNMLTSVEEQQGITKQTKDPGNEIEDVGGR